MMIAPRDSEVQEGVDCSLPVPLGTIGHIRTPLKHTLHAQIQRAIVCSPGLSFLLKLCPKIAEDSSHYINSLILTI